MRPTPNQTLERYRMIALELERYGTTFPGKTTGIFMVRRKGVVLRMIASTGHHWEHVSVSLDRRCPTWDEMCFVKDQFWDEEEVVVQIHPRHSEYVNYHPFCLHLWKPLDVELPSPPSEMVGPRA